jgi:hypothetical protein
VVGRVRSQRTGTLRKPRARAGTAAELGVYYARSFSVITPDHAARAGVCATSEKVETVGIEPTQRSRREDSDQPW